MITIEELYSNCENICKEYEIDINEEIKSVIKEKVEYIKTREQELFFVAKNSIKSTDIKYPNFIGKVKTDTIIKKFEKVQIRMLIVWDEFHKIDFSICLKDV